MSASTIGAPQPARRFRRLSRLGRRILGTRVGLVGAVVIAAVALMAILAPVIAPYDPVDSLIGVGAKQHPCRSFISHIVHADVEAAVR